MVLSLALALFGGFMTEMPLTSVVILLVGGVTATRMFAQISRLRDVLLVPAILVRMCVGGYVINGCLIDLWIMPLAGLAGYVLEKVNIPLAPIILGMILEPMQSKACGGRC